MVAKQSMVQAIIQEASAAIMAVKEAENQVNAARSIQVIPRTGGSALKQPTCNWNAAGKYQELWNFGIEGKGTFSWLIAITCKIIEKVPIKLNCLGREGLKFMQTLNDEEQGKFKTSMGLFEVLSENFKLQHNETILSLQYFKLIREQIKKIEV